MSTTTKYYEDHGRKGKRLTNNIHLFSRSSDNKKDVPIVRVNQEDEIEFPDRPHVEGKGPVALLSDVTGTSGQYFFRDSKVVSQDNVNTKSFELSHAPTNPEAVLIIPVGGPTQSYGDDFIVEGKTVRWDGLGLEGMFEIGDKVLCFYQM